MNIMNQVYRLRDLYEQGIRFGMFGDFDGYEAFLKKHDKKVAKTTVEAWLKGYVAGANRPQERTIKRYADLLDSLRGSDVNVEISRRYDLNKGWPQPIVDLDDWLPTIRHLRGANLDKTIRNHPGDYVLFQASSRHARKLAIGSFSIRPAYLYPLNTKPGEDAEPPSDTAFLVRQEFEGDGVGVETFSGMAMYPHMNPCLCFIMRNDESKGPKYMMERESGPVNPFSGIGRRQINTRDNETGWISCETYKHQRWSKSRHFTGTYLVNVKNFPDDVELPTWVHFVDHVYAVLPEISRRIDSEVFTTRTQAKDETYSERPLADRRNTLSALPAIDAPPLDDMVNVPRRLMTRINAETKAPAKKTTSKKRAAKKKTN